MAKHISEILEAREPYFSQRLMELEKVAGRPGVDVRLVSDLVQRQKNILTNLGFSRVDTHPAELYHALIEKALNDSKLLATKIGISPSDSPETAVTKSLEFVRKISGNNRVWTLRSSVARKQLKDNPPTKLMKIFARRSIDSALKRDSLSLLFTFAKKIEPKKWHEKYISQATTLNSTDFDYQIIEITQVQTTRQAQLKKAGLNLNQIIYVNYDVAGIVIITPQKRFDGDVLFFVHSILENIKLLKSSSLFFKFHSMETDFPSRLEAIRSHGFGQVAKNYNGVGWTAYSSNLNSSVDTANEALDIMFEDDAEAIELKDILEEGSFWQHHYLVNTGENFMVSCNLSDVILNAVNKHEPHQSHYQFGQQALLDELFSRYLEHPAVREYIEKEASQNG